MFCLFQHRRRSNIFGGGGGGSSGETKIAEEIRDAKNRRFLLYIAFAGKSGRGATAPQPPRLRRPESKVHNIQKPCLSLKSGLFH